MSCLHRGGAQQHEFASGASHTLLTVSGPAVTDRQTDGRIAVAPSEQTENKDAIESAVPFRSKCVCMNDCYVVAVDLLRLLIHD